MQTYLLCLPPYLETGCRRGSRAVFEAARHPLSSWMALFWWDGTRPWGTGPAPLHPVSTRVPVRLFLVPYDQQKGGCQVWCACLDYVFDCQSFCQPCWHGQCMLYLLKCPAPLCVCHCYGSWSFFQFPFAACGSPWSLSVFL